MDVRSIQLTGGVPLRQAIPHRFFMLIATSAPLQVRKLAPGSLSYVGEIGRDVEASYKYFPLEPTSEKSWGGYELLSTVDQTVTLAVSNDQGDYSSILQTIRIEQAIDGEATADQTVGGAATEIAIADADAVETIVQNVGENNVRVSQDANVASNRGIRLVPGGSATFRGMGAIYAVREGGSDSSVAVERATR